MDEHAVFLVTLSDLLNQHFKAGLVIVELLIDELFVDEPDLSKEQD